jgi:hypothetical protein
VTLITDEVDHDTVTMAYCRGCGERRMFYVKWYTGYSRLHCSKVPWSHVWTANI